VENENEEKENKDDDNDDDECGNKEKESENKSQEVEVEIIEITNNAGNEDIDNESIKNEEKGEFQELKDSMDNTKEEEEIAQNVSGEQDKESEKNDAEMTKKDSKSMRMNEIPNEKKIKLYKSDKHIIKNSKNDNSFDISENKKKKKLPNLDSFDNKDDDSKTEEKRSRIATWDEIPEKRPAMKNFLKSPKVKKRKKKGKKNKKNRKLNTPISTDSLNINFKSCEFRSDIAKKNDSKKNNIQNSEYFEIFVDESDSKLNDISIRVMASDGFSKKKWNQGNMEISKSNSLYIEPKDMKSESFSKEKNEDISVAESLPNYSVISNTNYSYLQSERSVQVGNENQVEKSKKKKKKKRRKRKKKKKDNNYCQQDNTLEDFARRTSKSVQMFFDQKK
jgi:hypothetical protein